MSAYIMFNYNIIDRSKIDELTKMSLPVNKQYGATVLIGSPVKTLEGNAYSNMVVLEFINFEAAEKFYYSDEHKKLSVLRNEITEGWAAILPDDAATQALVNSGYFERQS
jgi:uncharacterized protein (DUF1330 family)